MLKKKKKFIVFYYYIFFGKFNFEILFFNFLIGILESDWCYYKVNERIFVIWIVV